MVANRNQERANECPRKWSAHPVFAFALPERSHIIPIRYMSEVRFACPQCDTRLVADSSRVGATVACPECGTAVTVPLQGPFAIRAQPARRNGFWGWPALVVFTIAGVAIFGWIRWVMPFGGNPPESAQAAAGTDAATTTQPQPSVQEVPVNPGAGPLPRFHFLVRNRTVHRIDPRLFGSFMERPSWGETGPEAALSPGTNRLQPEVLRLLREMHIPIVRFPGGTDADFIDWRDMVSQIPGRDGERPITTGHKGDKVTNRFGYDEFLRLSTELGWAPIIVVNFRDGLLQAKPTGQGARHAAELVAYCNAPLGAKLPSWMPDWPSIRARNGHPEPYKVKYWQIGNETWAFLGQTKKLAPRNPDAYYAQCLRAYVQAMLAVDPTIEFIVDGVPGGELVRKQMPGKIQHLVFHAYAPWSIDEAKRDGQTGPFESLSAAEIWRAWVATPGFDSQGLAVLDNDLITRARRQGFNVAVTEWNWNGWWGHRGAALDSLMAKGVGAAGFLHAFMRSGDVISIGCQSMLVGKSWDIHAIAVDPNDGAHAHFIPSGQVLALDAAHHGTRLLELEATDIPTYAQPLALGGIRPASNVAVLDALATADEQNLYFHVINRDFEHSLPVRLEASDLDPLAGRARLYALEGRLNNQPSLGEPAQVSNITTTDIPCDGSSLNVRLPARSVSCIEVPFRR